MPVTVPIFDGYTITVENGSSQYIGTGTDTETDSPIWEMGTMSVDNMGGSATIFYRRNDVTLQPKTYRKSIVTIKKGDTYLLYGEVMNQDVSHERVTLQVDSFIKRIDELAIYGATTTNSASGPDKTSSQAFSVFGEQSKPDKLENNDGFLAVDNRLPASDESVIAEWSTLDVAVQSFSYIDYYQFPAGFYFSYIDYTDIIQTIQAFQGTITEAPRYGLSPREGVIGLIEQGAHENSARAIWYIEETGGDLKYKVRFDNGGSTKALQMNNSGENTVDDIPYTIDINYDFDSPTKLAMYSGKSYIQSALKFETSSAELVTEKDETGTDATGRQYIAIRSNGERGANSTIGDLEIDDLPPSTKVRTQPSISPHITNLEDSDFDNTDIIFNNDFALYVKFADIYDGEDTFSTSFPYAAGHLLVDSELWQKAEIAGTKQPIQLFEEYDIDIATDRFEIRIYAPLNEDASDMGTDGNVTLENFKLLVDEIVVPVAIEVPHRNLALATRNDSVGVSATTEILTEWDYTDGSFEPTQSLGVDNSEEILRVAFVNEIRPVYKIKFVEYDETTATLTIETVGEFPNQSGLETLLKLRAGEELKAQIIDDATAVNISMPVDCYFDLPDTYPKAVGDAIDEITGDIQHGLPRRVQVADINLNNDTATITLQ